MRALGIEVAVMCCASALALSAAAVPAMAQDATHHAVVATADPTAGLTGTGAEPPIGVDIRQQLLNTQANPSEEEAVDWQALVAFYEGRADEPVWIGRAGYTAKAQSAMAEFATADEWGLNPDDFNIIPLADDTGDGAPLSRQQRIEAELRFAQNVLKYARYARGGRISEPTKQLSSYLDRTPQYVEPKKVLDDLAASSDAGATLRSFQPQHPEFERLRQRYLAMSRAAKGADRIVQIPEGPKLIPGKRHPHIALLRERLKVEAKAEGGWPADPSLFDDDLASAVAKYQSENGLKADGVVSAKTRKSLNTFELPSPEKILANMEQWRWMPDNLGDVYVWVNIPEFMVRVVKNGTVIHEERIVTGEVSKQTPIFSDQLETIYFNPRWNVPESIKVLELYPSLARGGGGFERQGLKLMRNGREVSPYSVDWSRADIRHFDVYQPSGPGNVLGVVKFTFPNKHGVYLHDTTAKSLFNEPSRPFSHGCMRVRNPMRLAEILLEADKGWSPDQVHETQQSNEDEVAVKIDKPIPVHVSYFTTRVAEDGTETSFKDVYGHEQRLKLALAGKFSQIARGGDHLAPVKFSRVQYAESPDDWGFFMNGGPGVIIGPNGKPIKNRYQKNNSSLNDFFNNMFGGN